MPQVMLLSCPSCATEYEVPDAALAGRTRKLRCQRCGTEWRAGEELPAVLAPPPAARWTVPVVRTPAAPATPQTNLQPQLDAPPGSYARVPLAWADTPQAADIRRFSEIIDAPAPEMPPAPAAEVTPPAAPPAGSLPSFLSGDPAPPVPEIPAAEPRSDRFAELVHAARSKTIEFEPESPAPQKQSRAPLLFLLLVAVVIMGLLLGHREMQAFVPALTPIYHGLGLQ